MSAASSASLAMAMLTSYILAAKSLTLPTMPSARSSLASAVTASPILPVPSAVALTSSPIFPFMPSMDFSTDFPVLAVSFSKSLVFFSAFSISRA